MESSVMQRWSELGFAQPPRYHVAREPLTLYRAWGPHTRFDGRETGTEWGSGFFSLEKPRSVLDAELRANIVNYGNRACFVSTFILLPGFPYWTGPVAHGADDLRLPLTQVYVEGNLKIRLTLLQPREVLRHDAFVVLPSVPPWVEDEKDFPFYRQ